MEARIKAFDLEGRVAEVRRRIDALDVERRVAAIEREIEALDVQRRTRQFEDRRDTELTKLEAAPAA